MNFHLKSYFKFLSRNKAYTVINLVGFSVSLMFVILLGLYILQENRIDRFQEKKDRIFRLQNSMGAGFAAPIAEDLKARYPEIESYTRLNVEETLIDGGKEQLLGSVLYADSTFFDLFSFRLAEGQPSQVLQTRRQAILNHSVAAQFFPGETALGKTIRISEEDFIVSGVSEDFTDTHLPNPDVIIPFENVGKGYLKTYNSCNFPIYLLIREGADLTPKLSDAVEYFKTYYWVYQKEVHSGLSLVPLTNCYYEKEMEWMNFRFNNRNYIRILGLAVLAILSFALINYINLSMAQTGFRAKEAATRRLLGSSRGKVVISLISESVLFCFGCAVAALLLALLLEPFFNRTFQSHVSVLHDLTAVHFLYGILFILLLGIVAGLIPAWAISGFQPIEVVRGDFRRKTKMLYSRVLIGFQFLISIILIGCTLTIISQTRFMLRYNLGFDKDNIVYLDNFATNTSEQESVRDRLMRIPGVEAVTFVYGNPMDRGNNWTITPDNGSASINFLLMMGDSTFFSMLGLTVLSETGSSSRRAAWINETGMTALEASGMENYFQDNLFKYNKIEEFAGVVKDFHVASLDRELRPVLIFPLISPDWAEEVLVKIGSTDPGKTYRDITAAYRDHNRGKPFKSGFMDAEISSWYDEQQRTYTVIGYFSLLAVLIAALGLLAMVTYFMRQQSQNIAIRKIFGSSNREILQRLIGSFLKIVGISFLIAIPIIWYAMSEWLKGYAYHIPLHWTIFARAGAIGLLIAFIAVFWQSYRAATTNPAHVLHSQ